MKLLLKTLFIILFYINLTQGYKICALRKHQNTVCEQLERRGKIKCVYVDNEASCLTKIDSGEIDFGSINAESAFLGSRLTQNVFPVALTKPETTNSDVDYETVIVSKEKFTSPEGMSYCHPGFENTTIPPLILKEFENHLLEKKSNLCDTKKFESTIEWEMFALNKIFGPSCRPGKWISDTVLNDRLHEKYPELTKLCSNLNGSPLEKSLNCMLNTENSISLTTLNTINAKVNKTSTPLWYYCKNGTVSNEPCVWSKQPYQFIVINKRKEKLQQELRKWLIEDTEPDNREGDDSLLDLEDNEIDYIKKILEITVEISQNTVQNRLKFVKNNTITQPWDVPWDNLEKFIKNFRDIPSWNDAIICKQKIRWCTISDEEQKKCEWLSQASINYGIQPVVECVQKSDELQCLKAINEKSADLVTTSADFGYAAKKFKLSAIAFPETMSDQKINTVLLIKNNKSIDRLENLKGKKGCFPLYSGIAWLSFVETMRGIVLPQDSCDYGKLLSDLLGDSCMPGAMDTNRAINNAVDSAKMCKLCVETGKTCDASEATNLYFNNVGALRCLENTGDFAVIVKDPSIMFPNNVRVMCRNGTFSTMDGFDVDEACYLSALTTSEMVTRNDDPLNKDISLALMEYDEWFASKIHTPFRLFDSFNGIKDLLFKDSTPGLDLPNSQKAAIKNYVNLFQHIDSCAKGSAVTDNPSKGIASIALMTTTLLIGTIIINMFL